MSKEEKAKEYAKSVVDESVENYIGEEIFDSHIEYVSQCYIAGYTQAEQDLSTENVALKESLSSIITHVYEFLEYNINDKSAKETIVRLLNVTKTQLLSDQDLSSQLAAYKDALRELVESLDGFHVENMGISREVEKAKILIE